AGAAADAGGGVHGRLRHILRDQDRVAVLRSAELPRGVPARRDDAVERAAVHDQILHDWKRLGAPRLDDDRLAVLEATHVQLADRGPTVGAVRHAVDDEAAHAADAFAAV